MRRLTLRAAAVAVGIVASASSASAGYNWAGCYFGANAGGAWGTFDPKTATLGDPLGEFAPSSIAAFDAAGIQSIKPDGFTGGFEGGYNWQFPNALAGIEGDIESFRLSGSANSGPVVYPCARRRRSPSRRARAPTGLRRCAGASV